MLLNYNTFDDGITWANIDSGTGTGKTQFATSSNINDIVYGGGKFLAVASQSSSSSPGSMAISNTQ